MAFIPSCSAIQRISQYSSNSLESFKHRKTEESGTAFWHCLFCFFVSYYSLQLADLPHFKTIQPSNEFEIEKIFWCLSVYCTKSSRKVAEKFGRYWFLVYLCTRFHKDECLIASLAQLVRAHDC